MESDQDSSPSFPSSPYNSSSSIKEREDIANDLQDRIKNLLKIQKRNEKLKQSVEEFKRKIEQYRTSFKDLQEQFKEIIQCINLPENSPLSTILEKIKNLQEIEAIFQEIKIIADFQNNGNKKNILLIIKEFAVLKKTISEMLGENKSVEELIDDVKKLKESKEMTEFSLKELGTNNFEFLIENQKESEQQQQQICSLLGIKCINNKKERHKNIKSAINDLKNKPSEIFNEIGQLISPNLTEKVESIHDIKRMINELKQKTDKLNKQNEKLTTESQSNKSSLNQLHFTSVDEVTSIISNVLSALNIKSPALIQSEIKKKIQEKEELDEKLNELQQKNRKIENEKNSLENSLNDKEEEINSLKSLLQTEKGNVKQKFDEFNEQVISLKSDIKDLQTKNEELLSNQKEITNDLQNANEELESTKKSLKKQIESNNELTQKVEDFENKNEILSSKLEKVKKEKNEIVSQFEQSKGENQELSIDIKEKEDQIKKIQKEFDDLKETFNLNKQKSVNLQKILNVNDSDHLGSQIQDLLSEISNLKNSNKELVKEKQNIAKILNVENENPISETIKDLLETQAEQKAENQDLTQKISAIASFLNIPDPQSATLATIQKTIRNLQKDLESEQNEKLKIKNENDSLNQKYEVLLDTQNEIQNSLNLKTFQSSNELIKAVSENEKLISNACEKLNVNRDDFLKKVSANDEIISELCKELNTDESSLIQVVKKQKNSIAKASNLLNVSGSSIEKVIEDNNDLMSKVCSTMNCSKEKVVEQVERNAQVLNDLLKQSNCEHVDQLSNEFSNLKKAAERSKQQLDDTMNKLNIKSTDKITSSLVDLQKEAEKASFLEEKTNEISSLMNIQNGNSIDDVKRSVQNLMSENKRLNDTFSRIQTIMNSSDILNSITLMSTVFKSIQKYLPKSTDLNEIPTIIGHYQSDSEAYNNIQKMFPSRDPLTEINTMQKELNEIYSIFNMKKFEDPVEIIKLNNDFTKSVIEVVNNSVSGRKNRVETLNSVNNQEIINSIEKAFDEQREIMNLLRTESPVDAVKKLIDKKREIGQIVNLNSDEEPTEIIQQVVGLKNDLSSLLDMNETSDILSTVQKQRQTSKDLFSILKIRDSDQLVSKARELAEIESLIKKLNPDEKDCKEAILKNEKEKKEMSDFVSKLLSLLKISTNSSANSSSSSISSHSSHSSSKSSKNSTYKQILKKVHKMAKISNEICQLLNCSESSLIEQISKMKNDLESINEMFNSEASDETKIVQSAQKEKQFLKSLKKAVDASKYSDILPKVNELQEKLNQSEMLKSRLNNILDISSNSQSSLEQKAEECRSKINQFIELISVMNCQEDEAKSIIINLLNNTNSSSIKDVPHYISSMRNTIEQLMQKIQNDNSILCEFLNDGENGNQFIDSQNIVQQTMNKFKRIIFTMEEKLNRYDNELNNHANFIKNTSNYHYPFDEIQSIYRSHEEQIKQLIQLLSSDNMKNDFSSTIQKVKQLKQQLKELKSELNKMQQRIEKREIEMSTILSACAAKSPEFAIDIINSMKRQISELIKENGELKTYQTVEESFKSFEKKEKQIFGAIGNKLNDINEVLQIILSTIDNGRCQKAEMKKLIETALLESIHLREILEGNEEKWMLFGSDKKGSRKSSLYDEIRSKKKEIIEQQKKAEKAEMTLNIQQQNQHHRQKFQKHQQPHTLL